MKKFFIILKKAIILFLPVIGFVVANLSVKTHTSFCLIKFLFGHECWGCGLTRAFAALGRLDFSAAYEFNHLIVIVAPLLFLLWICLIKNELFKYEKFTNKKGTFMVPISRLVVGEKEEN